MKIRRIFASVILAALALGFIAAPPAQAADKIRIIYGDLCVGDTEVGMVRYDGKAWTLNEEAWKESCATIANAGANAVRILPYGVWDPRPFGRRSQFQPWALDAAKNLWDLSKFNAYYFPIMRRVVEIANSYGMEAILPWLDMCQLHDGYWTPYSPWLHNVNGVGSFYDLKADPFVRAFVKRMVKETAGLKVFWPWGNELGSKRFPEWARRVIFPLIRELNIPFDRMTYGAVMGEAPYLGGGKFGDAFTLQDTARKYFGEDFPPESNKFLLTREVHKCGTTATDKDTPWGLRPAQAAFWWGYKPVGKFWLIGRRHERELALAGRRQARRRAVGDDGGVGVRVHEPRRAGTLSRGRGPQVSGRRRRRDRRGLSCPLRRVAGEQGEVDIRAPTSAGRIHHPDDLQGLGRHRQPLLPGALCPEIR